MQPRLPLLLMLSCLLAARLAPATEIDPEATVKREAVFEFTEAPKVTWNGTAAEITFTAKGYCDVTVAVEDEKGNILRHLASGVLGDNAPAPFLKKSLRQTLLWDVKDDEGKYVEGIENLKIRVSLGLKPVFEKSLFEEPRKRYSRQQQAIICPAKEGVYVYDGGNAVDFVRLYDHDGKYVRTVYPFPGDKLKNINGLTWRDYPEDNSRLPVKGNFLQNSLLTGGTQAFGHNTYVPEENLYRSIKMTGTKHYGMDGWNAVAMALGSGRIATADVLLNRFGTDGSSAGMTLTGPRTALQWKAEGAVDRGKDTNVPPHSAALSPDGETLYLTCYLFSENTSAMGGIVHHSKWGCFNAVYKLSMDEDKPLEIFVGSPKPGDAGSDNTKFNTPTSVAVDPDGQVYVADFLNDRVQVYTPAGQFVRTIKVARPAQLTIDPVNSELIVASYLVHNETYHKSGASVAATLTRMGPLNNPAAIASYKLPTQTYVDKIEYHYYGSGVPLSVTYDPYGSKPRVWVSEEIPVVNAATKNSIRHHNIRIFEIEGKALVLKRDFDEEVLKSALKVDPVVNSRQRIAVNPKTGKLYVCEGQTLDNLFGAFYQAIQIDPDTGKLEIVELPFDAEDMCFDRNGLAYLRSYTALARYQPDSPKWREVPFDYGDEYIGNFISTVGSGRRAEAQSALTLPANGGWHAGGMYVSVKGNLVVCCNYSTPALNNRNAVSVPGGRPWQPVLYPGRSVAGRGGGVFIHVWNKSGKIVYEDAVKGLADNLYGLGLDQEDNVYALMAASRMYKGRKHFNDLSGTLIKVKPLATKILSDSDTTPIPLGKSELPQRPPDINNGAHGNAWVESGAEWMFGGVGFCGKNLTNGCACFNCRFAFDYFNRSFAPELHRYSVAVIDSAGNLICRVGKYGNQDSAGPASRVPLGGDEVGLLHGAYVAVHTDKRLFIADPGNGRIVSVKLEYQASASVPIRR